MKTLALVPVFNESTTIIQVLMDLEGFVDDILLVNDGSSDESENLIRKWMADGHHNAELVTLKRNSGYSRATLTGFALVEERIKKKQIGKNDIVVTIDGDGQHKPSDIPVLKEYLQEDDLALVRTRRQFEKYSKYKRLGNKFMSSTVSIIAGQRCFDAESGFLLMRASTIRPLLQYATGYRYSICDEFAVILPRLGYKVSDEHLSEVLYFRSNTRISDVIINLTFSFIALLRVKLRIRSTTTPRLKIRKRFRERRRKTA